MFSFIIYLLFMPGLFSCLFFCACAGCDIAIWAASVVDIGALFRITPSERLQNVKNYGFRGRQKQRRHWIKKGIFSHHLIKRPRPCDSGIGAADGKVRTAWEVIRNPWKVYFVQEAVWQIRERYWQYRAQSNHLCSHKITFTFSGGDWHRSKQVQTGKGTW